MTVAMADMRILELDEKSATEKNEQVSETPNPVQ